MSAPAAPTVRRRTLGALFGVLGAFLLGYVAGHLDGTTQSVFFERPPDPLDLSFSPTFVVVVVGLVHLATAVACFLGPRAARVARILLGISGALLVPLSIAVALALSDADSTNVMQLFVESFKLGVPIALGAMGGLWCERSGVVNIGIEGMMLTSAVTAFMSYALIGDARSTSALWLAVLIAVLTGGLVALLHAVLTVTFRVDQIISGVVINLLAVGVTGFLRSEVILPTGISTGRSTRDIALPLLSDLPIVGEQLFTNRPIFFATFLVVGLTAVVLFRTPFGLRVRACGEHPHAAETLGIDVIRTRYAAVVIGGMITGLAGAWFALEAQVGFEDGMTSGAGFIALAAVIFGRWRPWAAFAGALLFGFARSLGARMQILDVELGGSPLPSELWQSLPFVVTIVVVAGVIGRAVPPAADGVPFERSR